jgi:heptosyltransferase-2
MTMVYPGKVERRSSRPWQAREPPSNVLVIRFHAIGDVALTLPYCVSLRKCFPEASLEFLTSMESADLLRALTLVDKIHLFDTYGSRGDRLLGAARIASALRNRRYDLVIDLQRNWQSRLIRRILSPGAWSEFDRFSRRTAAERIGMTIQEAGVTVMTPTYRLPMKPELIEEASRILLMHGWSGESRLIVLNPAGLWRTRNWPLESYFEFAEMWSSRGGTQFLLLGTDRIVLKARMLKERLGAAVIDLSGRTTLSHALALLQLSTAVLSEDSGLMHMAWACGIPTVALFGSTDHVWARPIGEHCVIFHSGDLPCGSCMDPSCRYGDVHCLTRYTPQIVFDAMLSLLRRRIEGALS